MIRSIEQNFCPFSHDLKIAYRDYGKLPLCAKIQVIAFTAIAALSSCFLLGLLAFPAFKWSVRAFTPAGNQPEEEKMIFTPNPTPVREGEATDLFALNMLKERQWQDLDLLSSGNDLERCFRL